jgi:hypothetical protein
VNEYYKPYRSGYYSRFRRIADRSCYPRSAELLPGGTAAKWIVLGAVAADLGRAWNQYLYREGAAQSPW